MQEKQSNATEENAQSTVSSFMFDEALIDAEIMWVPDVVTSDYSPNSWSSEKDLFKCSAKCSYMINYGWAPNFQDFLQLILTNASFYVLFLWWKPQFNFEEGSNGSLYKFLGQLFIHCQNLSFNNIMFNGESHSPGCVWKF